MGRAYKAHRPHNGRGLLQHHAQVARHAALFEFGKQFPKAPLVVSHAAVHVPDQLFQIVHGFPPVRPLQLFLHAGRRCHVDDPGDGFHAGFPAKNVIADLAQVVQLFSEGVIHGHFIHMARPQIQKVLQLQRRHGALCQRVGSAHIFQLSFRRPRRVRGVFAPEIPVCRIGEIPFFPVLLPAKQRHTGFVAFGPHGFRQIFHHFRHKFQLLIRQITLDGFRVRFAQHMPPAQVYAHALQGLGVLVRRVVGKAAPLQVRALLLPVCFFTHPPGVQGHGLLPRQLDFIPRRCGKEQVVLIIDPVVHVVFLNRAVHEVLGVLHGEGIILLLFNQLVDHDFQHAAHALAVVIGGQLPVHHFPRRNGRFGQLHVLVLFQFGQHPRRHLIPVLLLPVKEQAVGVVHHFPKVAYHVQHVLQLFLAHAPQRRPVCHGFGQPVDFLPDFRVVIIRRRRVVQRAVRRHLAVFGFQRPRLAAGKQRPVSPHVVHEHFNHAPQVLRYMLRVGALHGHVGKYAGVPLDFLDGALPRFPLRLPLPVALNPLLQLRRVVLPRILQRLARLVLHPHQRIAQALHGFRVAVMLHILRKHPRHVVEIQHRPQCHAVDVVPPVAVQRRVHRRFFLFSDLVQKRFQDVGHIVHVFFFLEYAGIDLVQAFHPYGVQGRDTLRLPPDLHAAQIAPVKAAALPALDLRLLPFVQVEGRVFQQLHHVLLVLGQLHALAGRDRLHYLLHGAAHPAYGVGQRLVAVVRVLQLLYG